MATVSVSVKVDKRKLERLIRAAPAEATREVRRGTERLRDDVVRRMPSRSGATARKTKAVMRGPYDGAVEIPEVPGRYLIEGTGLYGPKHRYIVPVAKTVLAWRQGTVWVFARRVRGIKPNSFAQDAARAALSPFQRAVAGIFGGG
jgi:hypothetical protein